MDNYERKSIAIELKADEEGLFSARIATLDVIDHDGDLTLPGAFPQGKDVLVSAYEHASWMGSLPVGVAKVREDGDQVIADGQFNLNSTVGRDHYETVKFSGKLQEWSYGFQVLAVGNDKDIQRWTDAHEGARPQRIIKKVDPFELSPVLKGAGIGTATLGIKAGLPYVEHMEAALAAVSGALERTKSLADLRRGEGRDLSDANMERIKALAVSLSEVKEELEGLLVKPTDESNEAAISLYLRYLKTNDELKELIR